MINEDGWVDVEALTALLPQRPANWTDLTPAVLYARQSLTREGSESLVDQVEKGLEGMKFLGIYFVAIVVERPSTSAYKDRGKNRPEFLRIIRLLDTGQIRAVWAYKTDRLSRGGGIGWAPLLEAAESRGLDLDRLVATPSGWMSEFELGIRATMDREESKKTSGRIIDAREREARAGKPRPSFHRPYGYEKDCLTIVPREAEQIREAARRVLEGETAYQIVSDWTGRNVPTARGGAWTTTSFLNVMRRPHNAGLRAHKGIVIGDGLQEAILDRDTFALIEIALRPRRQLGRRQRRTVSPVSGLLRCGECNARLVVQNRGDGSRRFVCKKGPGFQGCGKLYVTASYVEEIVKERVFLALTDPKGRRRVMAKLAARSSDKGFDLVGAVTKIDRRLGRLLSLYEEEEIEMAEYKRRKAELILEREQIEALVTSNQAPTINVAGLPEGREDLARLWDEKPLDWQQDLVRLVVTSLPIKRATKTKWDPSRLDWDAAEFAA